MRRSLEQVYHPCPFFLHSFKDNGRVRIETEHRLVQQGHIGPASFLHPKGITGAVGIM
jgi:hypothetical protein